MKKRTQKFAIF